MNATYHFLDVVETAAYICRCLHIETVDHGPGCEELGAMLLLASHVKITRCIHETTYQLDEMCLIDNIIYEGKVTAKLNCKYKIYFCIQKTIFMKHFPIT